MILHITKYNLCGGSETCYFERLHFDVINLVLVVFKLIQVISIKYYKSYLLSVVTSSRKITVLLQQVVCGGSKCE